MSDKPKDIFENKIKERIKSKPALVTEINASYQFVLTGEDGGDWYVDLTKPGGEVGSGTIQNPGITVTMTSQDFVALVAGKLNGQLAFMQGKLKIKGDMAKALKLQQILT